jgi:hypothetical protein
VPKPSAHPTLKVNGAAELWPGYANYGLAGQARSKAARRHAARHGAAAAGRAATVDQSVEQPGSQPAATHPRQQQVDLEAIIALQRCATTPSFIGLQLRQRFLGSSENRQPRHKAMALELVTQQQMSTFTLQTCRRWCRARSVSHHLSRSNIVKAITAASPRVGGSAAGGASADASRRAGGTVCVRKLRGQGDRTRPPEPRPRDTGGQAAAHHACCCCWLHRRVAALAAWLVNDPWLGLLGVDAWMGLGCRAAC